MNLLDQTKIYKPTYPSSEAAAVNSTFIDCLGYEGVLFLLSIGSSVLTSTGSVVIVQTSHTASTAAGIAYTFSNKVRLGTTRRIMAIDVVKPLKRYVSLRTITCTGVGIHAIAYSPRRMGSTEARSVINATSNQPSAVWVCTTE